MGLTLSQRREVAVIQAAVLYFSPYNTSPLLAAGHAGISDFILRSYFAKKDGFDDSSEIKYTFISAISAYLGYTGGNYFNISPELSSAIGGAGIPFLIRMTEYYDLNFF